MGSGRALRAWVGVISAAIALAGCTDGGDADPAETEQPAVERTGDPVVRGDEASDLVRATSQRSSGEVVIVDEVVLSSPSYVVVYADGGGAPGAQLGASELLEPGTATDVAVTLERPLQDDATVHAMLHAEDNGNDVFDFPEHDAPVEVGVGIVEVPFMIFIDES